MTRSWLPVAMLALPLASCSPWTIRPIGEKSAGASDPAAVADTLWTAKLSPAILNSAQTARALLDAIAQSPDAAGEKFGRREVGGAWQFPVKGEGRALGIDRHSRNGLLLLDIAPYDGRPDVSIQIGPVLRGMSLRDATGLVNFNDFSNQIEYAEVGNELNRRVLEKVLAPVDLSSVKGRMITFAGAFALEGADDPPIHGVVPILLRVETAR